MPKEVNMWWKTTVDSITVQDGGNVRAIAQVRFAPGSDTSGNYFAEENGVIHFLHNDNATLISAQCSFTTGTQTTWKYSTAITTELTNENVTKRRKVKKASQQHIGESQNISDRCVTTKNNPQKSTKQLASRPKRKIKPEQEEADCVSIDSTGTDSHFTDAQNTTISEMAIALNNVNSLYSGLKREVAALQGKVQDMDRERLSRAHNERTREKRMRLKYELEKQLKRSLTRTSGETCFAFSSVLRRYPFEFAIDCALSDFAAIAMDVNSQFTNGIRYEPSHPAITSGAHPLAQKHIVFDDCDDLLQWIGINNRFEKDSIRKKFMKKKGNAVLQILGGVHWDVENNQRSLHFFPGKSSSRGLPIEKTEEEIQPVLIEDSDAVPSVPTIVGHGPVGTISLLSTEWDSENNCFKGDFHVSSARTHINNISTSNILDFDAFTLSWKPLKGLRPQDLCMDNNEGGSIVLGKLVLYIPAVLFFGDQLTKKISDMT